MTSANFSKLILFQFNDRESLQTLSGRWIEVSLNGFLCHLTFNKHNFFFLWFQSCKLFQDPYCCSEMAIVGLKPHWIRYEHKYIRPSWSLQQPMSGHVGGRSTHLSQLHASYQMTDASCSQWDLSEIFKYIFRDGKDNKHLWGQKSVHFCRFHLFERIERVHVIVSDRRRRRCTRQHNVPPVLSFDLNAFPYIWISWRGSYRGEQLMQLI